MLKIDISAGFVSYGTNILSVHECSLFTFPGPISYDSPTYIGYVSAEVKI